MEISENYDFSDINFLKMANLKEKKIKKKRDINHYYARLEHFYTAGYQNSESTAFYQYFKLHIMDNNSDSLSAIGGA